MANRIKLFDEKFTHPAMKHGNLTATQKKKKIEQSLENSMLAKLGDDLKNKRADNVSCVASFNDWMPIRMKTLRTLNMEKFKMDTDEIDVPKKTFLLDHHVALCA